MQPADRSTTPAERASARSIATQDRPREKLERHGAAALGDNELVALIIGHGTRAAPALTVADRLLAEAGGVHGLVRRHLRQLARTPGIGLAVACRVVAALELGRRTLVPPNSERPQFLSQHDVARYLLPLYGAGAVERLGVLMLDTRHRLLATRIVFTGSLDAVSAHPREILREATILGAAAVVVFHNHPSGDPTPSAEDRLLTRRLWEAGHVLGIEVLDHIVMGDTHYVSLKDRGWTP
jgi:DNA repair protein RadC